MITRAPISSTLDIRLRKKLDHMHDQTNIPITRLLDLAVCMLYEEVSREDFKPLSKSELNHRINCLEDLD